jgi:LacI family transcriptional regulator
MVTVREIAKRAGVSLGTVDRVLHDRGRVSPETAARVKAAVEELGFTPNVFARNLSASREYRIGVLMPGPGQDSGYWKAPLAGIERAAEGLRGYGFELETEFFDRYDESSFSRAFAGLAGDGVDGILMAPVIERAALAALDSLPGGKAPAVLCFDTGVEHPAVKCRIGQDSARSGSLAAHLMRLSRSGNGPVGVIRPDTDNKHIASRVEGFRSALAETGIRTAVRTRSADADPGSMADAIAGLMLDFPGLSGILIADSATHLAARALSSLGPRSMPLLGYDLLEEDLPFLESGEIEFIIAQSPAEQGRMAVLKLFEILVHGVRVEPDLLLPLTLVTRENYTEFFGKA